MPDFERRMAGSLVPKSPNRFYQAIWLTLNFRFHPDVPGQEFEISSVEFTERRRKGCSAEAGSVAGRNGKSSPEKAKG